MGRRTRDSVGGSAEGGGERAGGSKRPARIATIAYSPRITVVPAPPDSSVMTTARPPLPDATLPPEPDSLEASLSAAEYAEPELEDRPTQPHPRPASYSPHSKGPRGEPSGSPSPGDTWRRSRAPGDGWRDGWRDGFGDDGTYRESNRPTVAPGAPPAESSRPENSAASRDAIEAVERSRPSAEVDLLDEMRELFALDDWSGALKVADFLLGRNGAHEQARTCARQCRERLCAQYESKLGPLSALVTVMLNDAEVRWLGLDHRAGFLLSRVDGRSSLEELLDICGMPRLEALKTLVDLQSRGVIRIHA